MSLIGWAHTETDPWDTLKLALHSHLNRDLLQFMSLCITPSDFKLISEIPTELAGFEISLVRSSETSKNDSRTCGIPAGLVRRTTACFWFSHKLHWLCIFQTSEWYIWTIDFYNPLVRRTSAFNLKFWILVRVVTSFQDWLTDGQTDVLNDDNTCRYRWSAGVKISFWKSFHT